MSGQDSPFETGKRLQATGDLPGAEAAYREALAREADSFRVLNNLGTVLEDLGRLEDAEEALRKARELAPEAFPVAFNLGRVLHLRGNLAEACETYQAARELNPDSWKAGFNLGSALVEAGRLEEAERVLARAVELDPDSLKTRTLLGDALFHQGKAEGALEHFLRAAELDDSMAAVHFNSGKTLFALSREQEAEVCVRRAIELDPRSESGWTLMDKILRRQGKIAEAQALLESWLSQDPSSPAARHLLAAAKGEPPPRADDEYVRRTFDAFAETFDHTLRVLKYRGPEMVGRTLESVLPPAAESLRVLDAGCGTGLGAPFLRPFASRLVGVDLSEGMLAKARRRTEYDEIHAAELTAYLRDHPLAFDVIASADTLIYFGDLTELMAAAGEALEPGGWFVFTVEDLEGPSGEEYRLCPSGRYAHAETYLRRKAEEAGFSVIRLTRDVIRTEGGKPVSSLVLALRRHPGTDPGPEVAPATETRDQTGSADAPFREASLLHVSGDTAGAIAAYRRTLALDETHFRAWNNLGTLLESGQDLEEAVRCYEQAARHAPREAPPRYNLGHALQRQGRLDPAVAAYREALELNPAHEAAASNLARALLELERREEARELLEGWLRRSPDHPTARHLMGALGGIAMPRASREYVRSLFDGFAADFETSLADLGYRAPELVGNLFERLAPAPPAWDVLDAGCGTGLCAPRLRSRSRRLVGLDLSSEMLRLAAQRKTYDELVEEDIEDFCATTPQRFHAVVAADTLNYFGDLAPLLGGVRRVVLPGGLLLFTLEVQEDPGYRLRPHGRYTHGETTVREVLGHAGFGIQSLTTHTLRMEEDRPVRGFLIAAVSPP